MPSRRADQGVDASRGTATLVRCEAHAARPARCCRSCGVSYVDGGVYFCSVACMVRFAQELALEFELEVSRTA